MGVYINIEMPKCCAECDAEGHYENSYGDEYGFFCPFGYRAYTSETRELKRLDDCPLVNVPPHGRLVDADKLMQEMRLFIKENMLSRDDARELLETIEDAPTVLEAEEGE